jgi:hypothetical protein
VTALGWDCGPVGGDNIGKMIDSKNSLQSTRREEKGERRDTVEMRG